jgi:hypothetical protein
MSMDLGTSLCVSLIAEAATLFAKRAKHCRGEAAMRLSERM